MTFIAILFISGVIGDICKRSGSANQTVNQDLLVLSFSPEASPQAIQGNKRLGAGPGCVFSSFYAKTRACEPFQRVFVISPVTVIILCDMILLLYISEAPIASECVFTESRTAGVLPQRVV